MLLKYINFFLKGISKIFFNSKKACYLINYFPTYDEDGFVTSHNADFKNDEKFIDAYNKGFNTKSSNGWHLQWRIYNACFFAKRALRYEGVFLELGTNKGMTALAIVNYVDFKNLNKEFYLVDTFQGLVSDKLTANENKKNDKLRYSSCYNEVIETFKDFKNIKIVKGIIPNILQELTFHNISFLHIDLNSSISEIEAINLLWNKMSNNGVILLDDYAYSGYSDTKKAWDQFVRLKKTSVLTLPTGQGVILL
jgi:O-methyltransferase|tara:strand:+ start:162 stop:917 length:756 start_codon:yes stop_codon:yes gene_type:complete